MVREPARPIRVECYAGSRGEETPRRVLLGSSWTAVTVLEQWVRESVDVGNRTRWFRVHLDTGEDEVIYYDEALDSWFWRGRS